MSDPIRYAFSRRELEVFAREFMIEHEGAPIDLQHDQRSRWYVNMGLLTHFISELWERNPSRFVRESQSEGEG